MMHYLTMGTLLGLSAGMAPGPLLTLVISETLLHDVKAGIKVALAPLITDLPIIVLTVFILSRLSGFHDILGIISLVGSVLVLVMGVHGMKARGVEFDIQKTRPRSLAKGIFVNILSPHPYLFWLSVGAPTMTRAKDQNIFFAAIFVTSFYLLLIGSKITLAILVGKSKKVLTGRLYIYTTKFLGFLLCGLAVFLFKDGLSLLGVL
ncbi:MAG: LysE family transporter [Proteobacteria bacterium]|nr:LysE family transporter [Pseudomonadota bacterium]MBU1584492.1 LysE family transporter [Pseudomonadota bacterium]MBU2456063.1 LysE family transporter [Pseudomonadota bacterium]MBU2631003.1 LysE family transporter [Pseudomonadota bacterium]